jgi:hypothetical protein
VDTSLSDMGVELGIVGYQDHNGPWPARDWRGVGSTGDIKTIVDTGLSEMGGELGVVGISRP